MNIAEFSKFINNIKMNALPTWIKSLFIALVAMLVTQSLAGIWWASKITTQLDFVILKQRDDISTTQTFITKLGNMDTTLAIVRSRQEANEKNIQQLQEEVRVIARERNK